MHIEEAESAQLKKWIVKRLEDISDADSDVLADYVLALVKSEDPDEQVRTNCLENLEDFLHDHAAPFVDDVLNAIRTKSFDASNNLAQPQPSVPTGPSFNPPTGPASTNRRPSFQFQNGFASNNADQSRKRTWGDRAGSEQRDVQDSHYGRGVGGDRAMKQMRRGNYQGGAGRGGRAGGDVGIAGQPGLGQFSMPPAQNASQMPLMPNPPAGLPQFDPNNPMSTMLAMQALGIAPPNIPGMPQLPNSFGQGAPQPGFPQPGQPPARIGQRCRDYDTKGFCALGSICPFEHGTDPIIVPADEYDPKNAAIDTERALNGHGSDRRNGDRGRGSRHRGRGEGGRGRGGRATFSSAGPNHDRSITTIVVEQIPEEKFNEDSVREFFSEFGNIEEISMQPYKRLALVKYDDYFSARRAYDSPKVIFDNRFVKVYWYKPEQHKEEFHGANGQGHDAAKPDEEMVDIEEVKRRQEEAQRIHDEKQKQLQETEKQKAEVAEKLKAHAEERKKLLEMLSSKASKSASPPTSAKAASPSTDAPAKDGDSAPVSEEKSSQTEALKLKLAQLEAEAESMGLSPDDPYSSTSHRGRGGRGAFRGRAAWAPRGRGYDSSYHRGSYRGRGGFSGSPYGGARAGAVKRLDNRPKRVVVKIGEGDGEWTGERDEALRSHLFNNFDFESVEPYPDAKNAQVVAFKERYVAENFMHQTSSIPSIGPVTLSWAPNPPISLLPPSESSSSVPAESLPSTAAKPLDPSSTADDVTMGGGEADADADVDAADGAESLQQHHHQEQEHQENLDVADDDDRWMAA
ncbi:CCCH zinc finger and RRM domain-containing protein [Phyllosticta citribraziliensis]|uniref:CCCH zinc finger and RRM domain-containing protein n=1 Tax=Phyllosticta citribraziliensis TaxID=989973 RepID=A0ABR1LZ35_9PEZI